MGEKDVEVEWEEVEPELRKTRKVIGDLRLFLADVSRDWKEPRSRVLGHVTLSPPISFNIGEEGFMEDWAVIEMDQSKLDSTNFVKNVIDLGTTIPIDKFMAWMYPNPANPSSFEYPGDLLLKFHGTIPYEEMWKPDSKTCNHDNDPIIMVIKRGHASGLTIRCLNTICSFTRYYFKGESGKMSKEVAVLPCNSKSGAFSQPSDSSSSVVDGNGRLAGLLMGGARVTDILDCTYVTSINFLWKRLMLHGLKPNFFPSFGVLKCHC